MYKDPEKFKEWLSHQSLKCQRKWSDPNRVKKYFESLGKPKPKGKDSPRWIGDELSYTTAHLYVRAIKPIPSNCEKCGEPLTTKSYNDNSGRVRRSLDLCNINGVYNRDPGNYIWLCTKCHRKMDGHPYIIMKDKTRFNLFFNQFYAANSALLDCAENA